MSKYQIIKKHIDEYDYYSLLKNGAPDDEFDSYSREFAELINERNTVEEIAVIIAERLERAFGNEVEPEKFISVAEKIKEAMMSEI